ncbi:MAG: type VI secretion system protein TssA [bacterium]|nr:type VI secretion system protein TssA [bacterium]
MGPLPSFDENPILDLGKNPIPGAAPCGEDASEEEEFILVDAEIGKLGRIEADEPDWYRIEQAAVNLLRNKVKDIEIAGSLGLALFKRGRYAGLAAALGLFLELLNNFWDDVLPTRLRRRKARIEMLPDQFADGGWISENKPQPDDFDGIDLCVERIEALNTVLTEKMPDDPPDFGKFTRAIKGLAGQRPKPAAAAAPAAAPPADGAAAAAAPAGGGLAVGEVTDKSGATNAVMTAATFLRTADPADPRPYALVRVIKWSMISLPTSDSAKFEIPPPEASAVDALTHQMGKSMWDNLLKNSEAAFRSSDPLWLDLQRYTCAALKGLGANYEKAHDAVVGQTAALVRRLGDGLYELTFRGGMPLCNGETKMWIDSEVAVDEGGGGGGAMADGRLTEAAGQAKQLAASGKLKEALRSLQDGLAVCTQRRDRFLWRLRIAQLCFDSKRLKLAAPLLEECYEELKQYGIREWEPTLAVDAAQTLYRCRKLLMSSEKSPDKAIVDGVHESFAWLCQLDPLAALAAEPSGK